MAGGRRLVSGLPALSLAFIKTHVRDFARGFFYGHRVYLSFRSSLSLCYDMSPYSAISASPTAMARPMALRIFPAAETTRAMGLAIAVGDAEMAEYGDMS